MLIICISIVIGLTIILLAYWSFSNCIDADISKLSKSVGLPSANKILDQAMVNILPSPVQRYLHYTDVIGKTMPRLVYLKQQGKMRKTTESKWMNIEAEQHYSTSPPGFVWKAFMPQKRLPVVIGRDEYLNGKGSILMKMLALFTVADQKGIVMDEASLIRYLNEMMWFPQAYLGDNIVWKPVDNNTAQVILTDRGRSVSATLYFDSEGKLINFSTQRYNTESGKVETWETPIAEYGTFQGLKLPIAGSAVYKRKEGDLEYINLRITDIKYV